MMALVCVTKRKVFLYYLVCMPLSDIIMLIFTSYVWWRHPA